MKRKAFYLLMLGVAATWPSLTFADGDKLRIVGIKPGESVVVIWRGRTNIGCTQTYNVLRSTGETELPNLLPSDSDCPSAIGVFSEKHAMAYEPVNAWTSKPGDLHIITLKPLISVPVNLWTRNREDESRARRDMKTAMKLFQTNMMGIKFEPAYKNVPEDVLQSFVDRKCDAVAKIRKGPFYTAGRLNVYYVNSDGISGRNCAIIETPSACQGPMPPPADGDVTYIGRKSENSATLAHELGHAFGLRPAPCAGHTNGIPGFGPENIMWAEGGNERIRFTLGQVFRMNTHMDQWGGTMLIKNGLRPDPHIPCPPGLTSRTCPALNMDWPQ